MISAKETVRVGYKAIQEVFIKWTLEQYKCSEHNACLHTAGAWVAPTEEVIIKLNEWITLPLNLDPTTDEPRCMVKAMGYVVESYYVLTGLHLHGHSARRVFGTLYDNFLQDTKQSDKIIASLSAALLDLHERVKKLEKE